MTRIEREKEYKVRIKELENRLSQTDDPKRKTFLKASINDYSRKLGIKQPYKW